VTVYDSPNDGSNIPVPTKLVAGVATRIGDGNRFQFAPEGGEAEQLVLCGLLEFLDLSVMPEPIVFYSVTLPSRGLAVGATQSQDRTAAMAPADLVDLWFGGAEDLSFDAGRLVRDLPGTIVEITPALA